MKTYMEEQQGESFDWNKFLENAIRRKSPMDSDTLDDVIDRSQNWVTCACGNQCSIIPRHKDDDYEDDDAPIDEELNQLGVQFYECVKDQYWVEAKMTLKDIEARSATLIHEILQKSIDTLESFGYTVIKNK
jgi:hypothetical protein